MKKIIITVFAMFAFIVTLYGQKAELTISGTVHDDQDETLPGVHVYVKDKPGLGTVTNIDGKFTIKATKGDVIVCSFMGFDNAEHYVTKEDINLNIKMNAASKMIDELVVTGMGTSQRRISMVGAVTSVNVKELQTPGVSLPNMLGGRVQGVISMQNSGEPGKDISEFWIRGIGTFGANNQALVLIDGLEGKLNEIDPADIESFSVLKDASATAVYGVRGANGVILVTTKRGEEGKIQISGRINSTISQMKRLPDYVDSYNYAQLANEAEVMRGNPILYSPMELALIQNNLDPDLYPNVYWQKEILKTTTFKNSYYASIRGGGKVSSYFVSLGASDEPAGYKQAADSRYKSKTGYNKFTFRSNVDINLTKSTKVYFGTEGFYSKLLQPGIPSTDYLWSAQALLTPITIPLMYSTGHIPAYGTEDKYSPYVMLNHTGFQSNEETNMKVTLSVNQSLSMLLKGLSLRAQGAFASTAYFNESRKTLPDMYYAPGRTVNGQLMLIKRIDSQLTSYSNSQNQFRRFHFESTLNYENLFNDLHRISGLVYYYLTDQKHTGDISKYSSFLPASLAALPIRYQGVSSRLSYTFNDTYIADVNFGYTGSENFQPGRQYGFFPSMAVGWIPTQYKFMKDNFRWLNMLKFRYSYGSVGNDRLTGDRRFPYVTTFYYRNPGWGGDNAVSEDNVGADNLVWEKALKSNLGIEAQLLRQKLSITVDIFKDNRDGIFQPRTQVPDYIGAVSMPYGNVGKMVSYGSDGNASFTQKINDKSSITVRGNYTFSRNKVLRWEQPDQLYDYLNYSGWPTSVTRGFISLGLFRDQEDVNASPKQFGVVLPGDIKYKDVNGDGKIDNNDKVPLSMMNNYPNVMYGFGSEYTYKSVTLSLLFKGRGKTAFYHVGQGYNVGFIPFSSGVTGNVLTQVADPHNRWFTLDYAIANNIDPALAENPNAMYPRLTYGNNVNNTQLSDFWKRDGQYLKLQEVSVSYNLHSKFVTNLGFRSVDLQLVGTNLYTWDKVKLFDPEQAWRNGVVYPIPLQLTFQMYINL